MFRGAALLFSPLAVIYGLLLSAASYAQFPQIAKRCSPPSTLLRLSTQTYADQTGQSTDAKHESSYPKVVIERIDFDGPMHLPDSVVAQVISDFNERQLATNLEWAAVLTEIGLRGAWQNRGYFRVKATMEAHSLGGNSNEERFLVTAHVDEGLQYHLGELRFVGGTAFPETQLREIFPLPEGDLFRVEPIRRGMEELTKLYGSQGYIDFTATPETEVDDWLQRISLVMRLDEQRQFRVGSFTILGLDPSVQTRLRWNIRPGEFFNYQAAADSFKWNKWLLPPYASLDDLQARRNTRTGIVDLVLDFRPCPPI